MLMSLVVFPNLVRKFGLFGLLCGLALTGVMPTRAQDAPAPPPQATPAAEPTPAAAEALPTPEAAPIAEPTPAAPIPVPDEIPAEPIPAPPVVEATPTPIPPTMTPRPLVPAQPSSVLTTEGDEAQREKANQPVYLRNTEQLKIFDPGTGEQISPLQEAAQRLSKREEQRARRSLEHIQNLVTYEYTLQGTSQTLIVEEAMTRALKSAAARLYFDNYYLLGRDLLEPYLRAYGAKAVARNTVLDRRILTGDRQQMTIRVSVNLDELYKDLNEKHFIAKPNLRPIVGVHLQELINGQADTAGGGRLRIEQTMDKNLFRVFSRRMQKPELNVNLAADPKLLQTARFEAQRNGIDILISGTLAIRSVEQDQILYDDYSFQQADLTLYMYRVDTGEVLGQVSDRYSASGTSDADAIKNVLDSMVTRATQKFADQLREGWGNMMLEADNTRVMVSGVQPDEVADTMNVFKTFAPGIEISEKAYYGDVLVLNLILPNAKSNEDFEAFLRGSREPQFSVDKIERNRFILEVI